MGYVLDEEDLEELEENKSNRKSAKEEDKPVLNAGDIPLFSDADKRGTNTAQYLKIIKISGHKTGFKGQLPLSSTEETIFNAFGNGVYNIELCNHKHKVLRTRENVRIDIEESTSEVQNNKSVDNEIHQHLAYSLQKSNENHKEELKRQQETNNAVTEMIVANAKSHTEMVTKTNEASAQRDRDFMGNITKNQQDFFANMMAMQNNAFQQTMALLTAGHQQTMESLRAINERESQTNNPMLFLEIMTRGIAMGREFDGDDTPAYLQTVDRALSGIDKMIELKKSSHSLPVPQKNPSLPANTKKPKVLEDKEILNTIALKKVLHKRGIDFNHMISEAINHYQKAPDSEIFEDKDTEDNESDSDKPESKLES